MIGGGGRSLSIYSIDWQALEAPKKRRKGSTTAEGSTSGRSTTKCMCANLPSLSLFRNGRHLLRFDYACWRDWSVRGVIIDDAPASPAIAFLCHLEGKGKSVCLQIEHLDVLSRYQQLQYALVSSMKKRKCIVPSSHPFLLHTSN